MEDAKAKRAEKELTRRVLKTQSEVRRVDLLAAIGAFATLALALLLLGVLLDSWILPSGFSTKGRAYYALFWILSASVFFISRLVPVFRRRVSILFAAKELEEAWGDKRNLTINWLQLCKLNRDKDNPDEDSTREEILSEVALQAANFARKQGRDSSVDYSSLIRWGVVFVVVVALWAGYIAFSPKNPFVGAARIAVPLAQIERPQALRFRSITPGDAVVYRGDFLEIEAEIPGADSSSNVEVLVSSLDGRIVDVPFQMTSLGSSRFGGKIPDDPSGLEESVSYRVVVNRGLRTESESRQFTAEVRPSPYFRVETTKITFPEYAGIAPLTVENQGDVRALEGAVVSIVASGGADLERASFLPDGNPARSKKMTIDPSAPRRASIDFVLEWKTPASSDSENAREQDFYSYRLVSNDVYGEKNRDQRDYSVSIVPDLPPIVRWISGSSSVVEIPFNDVLRVELVAEDPDFSLRTAKMAFALLESGDRKEKVAPEPFVLTLGEPDEPPFGSVAQSQTTFAGERHIFCELSPEKLGLAIGDVVEYWPVVSDSKLPEPNVTNGERRSFKVVESIANPKGVQEPEEADEPSKDDAGNQNQNEGTDGESANSDKEGNGEGQNPNGSQNNESEESQGQQGEPSQSQGNQGENEESQGSEQGGEGTANENVGGAENDESSEKGGASETSGSSKGSEQNPNDSQTDSGSDNNDETSENGNSSAQNASGNDSPQDGSSEEQVPQNSTTSTSNSVDPSQAFETIKDYIDETGASSPQTNDGLDDSKTDESQRNGVGAEGDPTGEPTNESANEVEPNSGDEVEPNFDQGEDISEPKETRPLPKRTSPEKPNSDLPSYKASDPENVDPRARRVETDNVSNENNYLAQNATPNAPTSKNRRDDANIAFDPLDNSPATAADEIDANANEVKGSSDLDVPDAPSEIDREQTDDSSNTEAESDQTLSPGTSNGDSSETKENGPRSDNGSGQTGSDQNRSDSSNNEDAADDPSNGKSNDSSQKRGGGGGSGLGEIESRDYSLAPADAPKLQYAESASNLVLDYLEDVLNKDVDEELLKRLGWTEEQLRDFLDRWKKLRNDARLGDPRAKRDYLSALEKMELDVDLARDYSGNDAFERDPAPMIRDRVRTSSEASRFKTPDRLDERARAYARGISSSKTRGKR
ncbi:MAG: hypothetical protein IJM30_05810 [Thermoguttaceae bacterium]|nr:hypothetical protein [Thermoguttaceae bacterium]